jgi:hypothetical protein
VYTTLLALSISIQGKELDKLNREVDDDDDVLEKNNTFEDKI